MSLTATRTLRPGYLVSLRTTIQGGPKYQHSPIEHITGENGVDVAKWDTVRQIEDKEEYEAAIKVRSQCRGAVIRTCATSDFGLLCPVGKADQLLAGIAEASVLAKAFNETAKTCRVNVYVITGRIADNDQEAMRAIGAEVRGLLSDMQCGIRDADVKAIRDAADKARQLGAVLDDNASAVVNTAIEQAREAAREIVKRVGKAGEQAAVVISQIRTDAIENARFSFLDLDEGQSTSVPVAARALDLAAPVPVIEAASILPVQEAPVTGLFASAPVTREIEV